MNDQTTTTPAPAEGDEPAWTAQPQIVRNLLESCANWLDSRSRSIVLHIQPDPEEGGGYASLMREYAKNLRELNAVLTANVQPKGTALTPQAVAGEFASWARSKGMTAAGCDTANNWIRAAFEAGVALSAQAPAPAPEPAAWIRWEWNRSGRKSLVFEKPVELSLAEEATGVVYDPLFAANHG